MRIVFLAPCRGLAGGLRVIAAYGEGLRRRGHEVTIAFPRENLRARRRRFSRRVFARDRDFFDQSFHGRLLPLPFTDRGFAAHPVLSRADCVIATAWQTAEWLHEMHSHAPRKLYLVQGYETWNSEPQRLLATYRAPFQKVFVSRWLRHTVAQASGDRGICSCPVIPNGCDFEPIPESALGLNRPYDVGCTYSRAPHKNSAAALRTIERLRGLFPRLRTATFGSETLPAAGKIAGCDVWLRPTQSQIRSIYRRTKLWLVTSHEEGFCLPALEAMRQGCVVVAYDNGGIRDIVRSPGESVILDDANEDLLLATAETLLRNPLRMTILSRAARARSMEFQWNSAVDLFEALLFDCPPSTSS